MRQSVRKHTWSDETERAVVEAQERLQCGAGRLIRELPTIDALVIRAIYDRLDLGAENYHVWSEADEIKLIALHCQTGFGGRRLAKEFPGVPIKSIDTKLRTLRQSNKLPRTRTVNRQKLTNAQHRGLREFVNENRHRYRIPELTRRWNEIAVGKGWPQVSEDIIRYWARRKLKKSGHNPTPAGAFAEADRVAKQAASAEHRKTFEAEAAKQHQAAKERAATELKRKQQPKERCRWCETDFPHTEDYFKLEREMLGTGICIWCRDKQRRDLGYAKKAGKAAHAAYKLQMKKERRARFYDPRWEAIRAARLKLAAKLWASKPKPPERSCPGCTNKYPLAAPFFVPPGNDGKDFSKICCFCTHDFKTRIARARADKQPIEPIVEERRQLLLRVNQEARAVRKAALKCQARATAGPRAHCPCCGEPWPIAERTLQQFWRLDRGSRRTCLPCDWEKDKQRRIATSTNRH